MSLPQRSLTKMLEKVKGLITDTTDIVSQLSRSVLFNSEITLRTERNLSARAVFEDKTFEKMKGLCTDLLNIVLHVSFFLKQLKF